MSMSEEPSGRTIDPAVPSRPGPLQTGLFIGGLTMALGMLVAWMWGSGPRYKGRSAEYWFPNREGSGDAWMAEQLPELARGGPEVLDVVLASVVDISPEEQRRELEWSGRLPGFLRGFSRPRIAAAEREARVSEFFRSWLPRADGLALRAYTNAFDRLPGVDSKTETIRLLPTRSETWGIVEAHLLRLVEARSGAVGVAAAAKLLGNGQLSEDTFRRVMHVLGTMGLAEWDGQERQRQVFLLQALLPRADRLASAEPWLRGWWSTGQPPAKAMGALLLPFIAPEKYPVRSTVERVLPDLGAWETLTFGFVRHATGERFARIRREFVEVLAPILLGSEGDEWLRTRQDVPDRFGRGPGRLRAWMAEEGMRLVGALGTEASGAARHLPRWLTSSNAALASASVKALARLGPLAPELVPDLLPGLTNHWTAGPLVLLLASSPSSARAAEPLLRELASGHRALGVTSSLSDLQPAMREELGYPREPSAGDAARGRTSAEMRVGPACARTLGLTNAWPAAIEAAAVDERRTVAELASEALRRMDAARAAAGR